MTWNNRQASQLSSGRNLQRVKSPVHDGASTEPCIHVNNSFFHAHCFIKFHHPFILFR